MLKIKQLFCRHDWEDKSRKHYSSASAILRYLYCPKCGKVKDFKVEEQ